MLKFRKIRFRNFLSYGNNLTEIWLDYKPTTILIGESGSGKSTVTDAISFALFGKPFRPINKPQLVNSINNTECVVEIEFDVGTNHYLIRRGLKPAIFEIYCNDVLVNQDSHTKDYQDYLERYIIHMNYRTFSQIVVLGSSNFTPFMQMKTIDRRALVEDLLDIQIFSTMSLLLKDRISDIKTNITQTNLEIQTHKERIQLYNQYIEDLKKNKERQIEDNNKKITESEVEISKNNEIIQKYNDSICSLQQLIVDEQSVVSKISQYNDLEKDIENNLRKLKKELSFYETTDTCPTCHRDFDQNYKEEVIRTRQTKQQEYQIGIEKIQKVLAKIEIRYDEIRKIKNEIAQLQNNISQVQIHISSTMQYLDKIRQENKEIDSKQKDTTEELNKLKELTDKLLEFEKNREALSHSKLIHEIATNLLKDGGIKSKIIKQYLPIINKLVNRFLSAMNFYVTFNIDENFNETIRARGRDDYTYSCFSEGERQRLDIAILLTWRTIAIMKNSIRTNLLFIDELLDSSLDQIATENIIELITNEPILKNSNIFVISHKTNMLDKFSEYIKFEKQKNFSRIVP